MAKDEFSEQKALCLYIKLQYPDVIFTSDLSGIRLPQGLANKIKDLKCDKSIPDLTIYEPSKGYHGLVIEMKATGVSVYTQHGNIVSNEHIQSQEKMLIRFNEKGYLGVWGLGYECAKRIVDEYLR